MEKIELTAQQKSFMETFGYLSFPGLLDDCIDDIIAAFEKVWERHGGGHDEKTRMAARVRASCPLSIRANTYQRS